MLRRILNFFKQVWLKVKELFVQKELNEKADKLFEEATEIEEEIAEIQEEIRETEVKCKEYLEQDKKNQANVTKAQMEYLKCRAAYDKKWQSLGGENNPEYSELMVKLYATETHIIAGDAFQSSPEHKDKIRERRLEEVDEWLEKNIPEKKLMEEAEKRLKSFKSEASDFRVKHLSHLDSTIKELEGEIRMLTEEARKKCAEVEEIEKEVRKRRAKAIFPVLAVIGSGILLKGFLNPSSLKPAKQKPSFLSRFNDFGTFLKLSSILVETMAEFKMIDPLFQAIFEF